MSTNITPRLRDLVLEKDPLYVGGGSHRGYFQTSVTTGKKTFHLHTDSPDPKAGKQNAVVMATANQGKEAGSDRWQNTPKSKEAPQQDERALPPSEKNDVRHHIPPPSQGILPVPEDPHRLQVSLVQSRNRHKSRYEKLQRRARRRSAELKIEKRYQQAALLDSLDYRKRFQKQVNDEREQRDQITTGTQNGKDELLPPLFPLPNVRLRGHRQQKSAAAPIPSPSKLHNSKHPRGQDDKDRRQSRRGDGRDDLNTTSDVKMESKKNGSGDEIKEQRVPIKRHPSILPLSSTSTLLLKERTIDPDKEPNMTSLITTHPLLDSRFKYGRGTYMGVSCHV